MITFFSHQISPLCKKKVPDYVVEQVLNDVISDSQQVLNDVISDSQLLL